MQRPQIDAARCKGHATCTCCSERCTYDDTKQLAEKSFSFPPLLPLTTRRRPGIISSALGRDASMGCKATLGLATVIILFMCNTPSHPAQCVCGIQAKHLFCFDGKTLCSRLPRRALQWGQACGGLTAADQRAQQSA